MSSSQNSTKTCSELISSVQMPIWGLAGNYNFYRVTIPVSSGGQKRTFLISYELSLKLWKRYVGTLNKTVSLESPILSKSAEQLARDDRFRTMPGEECVSFLTAITEAITRKHARNDILTSWIAPKSLYKLWLFTNQVTTELFADCFNESGILSSYCSLDKNDVEFGALGTWEDVEVRVEGAAGNPPYDKNLISILISTFERGVQGLQPYCRLVILPVGESYEVIDHVESLTCEGELLVSAPAGCFPFMNEQILLTRDHLKSKPCRYQSVGILVWCNREYLLKHRPPMDIEEIYSVWIEKYLYNVHNVTLHRDAFLRAFPPDLRGSELLLSPFLKEVLHR